MEKLKYNFTGSEQEIIELIKEHKENVIPEIEKRNEYAKGNNSAVLSRKIPAGAPDNRIPISYARRMINLVTGYMYKPGLITYTSEKQEYLDSLMEIFKFNKEPMETEQIGRQTSIQGVGYELFFHEGMGEEIESLGNRAPAKVMPRFVKIPAAQTIAIYNRDIVPELTHFIYFWSVPEEKIEYISVYDEREVNKYVYKEETAGLALEGAEAHGFERVPLVVFENNEDMIGDFSCVVPLIDVYDVLMSDSANEFDRFAWAYLILKGATFGDEDVEDIKHNRVISGLNKDDIVEFLTKDINHEFIKFMSEWVRGEIHRQSGIPNLDDYKFGANTSGATLSKWIYLMELFTDPKESYFRQALSKRIEIITEDMGWDVDPEEIEIVMSRNMPDKDIEQAEIFEKYTSHISQKTLIENFADFVPDADKELEQLKEEQETKAEVNLDMFERRQKAFGNNEEENINGQEKDDQEKNK